jgi:hypothetical protein
MRIVWGDSARLDFDKAIAFTETTRARMDFVLLMSA